MCKKQSLASYSEMNLSSGLMMEAWGKVRHKHIKEKEVECDIIIL